MVSPWPASDLAFEEFRAAGLSRGLDGREACRTIRSGPRSMTTSTLTRLSGALRPDRRNASRNGRSQPRVALWPAVADRPPAELSQARSTATLRGSTAVRRRNGAPAQTVRLHWGPSGARRGSCRATMRPQTHSQLGLTQRTGCKQRLVAVLFPGGRRARRDSQRWVAWAEHTAPDPPRSGTSRTRDGEKQKAS
jgi:hypothetical protein